MSPYDPQCQCTACMQARRQYVVVPLKGFFPAWEFYDNRRCPRCGAALCAHLADHTRPCDSTKEK